MATSSKYIILNKTDKSLKHTAYLFLTKDTNEVLLTSKLFLVIRNS
ncbi:hypothetical protein Aasi_1261 [Candidatus Amoebophilus asiaticus 5a2]|uniref:Uncharacterized protein n=1 Tax=Amoebophilus asiaticus (strain 5a2) TaxID=452471 RepID=B3ETN1_AMOA5|nr:hypothetical protein Aasi_1261 [Candidatus Amoebophilus asiaticus 5a2]